MHYWRGARIGILVGVAALIVLVTVIIVKVSTLECLFEGQTLGKRIVKIKVVKIDGYQASFGDYLMRWLLRLVDVWTSMGVIGLIALVMSEKTQRLGDMTAGTAVITLRNKVTINSTILEDIGEEFGLTRERVRQIKDNAINKLRSSTRNKALKAYLAQ